MLQYTGLSLSLVDSLNPAWHKLTTAGASRTACMSAILGRFLQPVIPKVTMATSSPRSASEGRAPRSRGTTGSDDGRGHSDVKPDDAEVFTPFYGKDSPFSQHHLCHFSINETVYNCAEQYMMHQKAVLFGDETVARQILESGNPVEQKKLGRSVRKFDNDEWNKKCEDIVRTANMAKFSQNPDLKQALLDTRGTTLVEASPRDRKWGVGLGVKSPEVHSRRQWRGQNLLGQILTSVREEIEAAEKLKKT